MIANYSIFLAKEVLDTGCLKLLKSLEDDTHASALLCLSRIWGVGPQRAKALAKKGFR